MDDLRKISAMELKWRKGESQVIVAGYRFTVSVSKGTVKLMRTTENRVKVNEIINMLRAKYGDEFAANIRINRSNKRLAIVIPMYVFEKYDDIKKQVVEILCRKLERIRDEEKNIIIKKHLARLAFVGKAIAVDQGNDNLRLC